MVNKPNQVTEMLKNLGLPTQYELPVDMPYAPKPNLLQVRETTHGDFSENARLSQAIKEILRSSPGWSHIVDVEREAMDMIALKFSRILSGKSLERQHWEDVVGYAKLAERMCP